MSTTGTASLTLQKIGNFVGLKVRELLDLMSTKADRSDLDAIPRFFEAESVSDMITLDNVRIGDFCLRNDDKAGYRLRAFPSSDKTNWLQVFAAANANITKSVSFIEALSPIIQHDMNSIPSQVTVTGNDGLPNIAAWKPVDRDSIQIFFSELTGGVCSMTFQP